jgi:hypothetical protein
MIFDVRTKARGFLTKRERRIDIFDDDIYIWSIHWFSINSNFNNLEFMEEESLSMLIVAGMIELFSIKQGE